MTKPRRQHNLKRRETLPVIHVCRFCVLLGVYSTWRNKCVTSEHYQLAPALVALNLQAAWTIE